jgi:hypothetical protein
MHIIRTLHKPEVTEGGLIVLIHSMNNKRSVVLDVIHFSFKEWYTWRNLYEIVNVTLPSF